MAIVRFLYRLREVYISEWGGADEEISMHQFPVTLLSSANSYVKLNFGISYLIVYSYLH